jgi:PAS domain S-box-containing protein
LGPLRRDPILLTLLGVYLASAVCFRPEWGLTEAQHLLFKLLMPPLGVALVVLAWRAARVPGLAKPVRRFWLSLCAAGVLFALGDSVPVYVTVVGSSADTAGLVQSVFQICGTVLPLSMMLAYPTGLGSWRARARFCLDASAVMTAAAAFSWYFSIGATLGDRPALVAALVESGSTLIAVFAVIKLVLGGSAPFTRHAALVGAAAAAVEAITKAVSPVLLENGDMSLLFTVRLIPAFLIAAAPRVQELQVRADPCTLVRRPPRYSRLPYLAAIATHALLVVGVLRGHVDARLWGAVCGAATVAGLVMLRQAGAFSDNRRLRAGRAASERRFQSLIARSFDVTMIVDKTAQITWTSPAADRSLQVAPDRSPWNLVHPDDVAASRRIVAQLTGKLRESATWQVRARDGAGAWRWFEVTCTNLLDDPSVRGVVINAHDINEARKAQDGERYRAAQGVLDDRPIGLR